MYWLEPPLGSTASVPHWECHYQSGFGVMMRLVVRDSLDWVPGRPRHTPMYVIFLP